MNLVLSVRGSNSGTYISTQFLPAKLQFRIVGSLLANSKKETDERSCSFFFTTTLEKMTTFGPSSSSTYSYHQKGQNGNFLVLQPQPHRVISLMLLCRLCPTIMAGDESRYTATQNFGLNLNKIGQKTEAILSIYR